MKKILHRQALTTLLLISISSISLSGCGQKGPLYFPQEQVPESTTVPNTEVDATSTTKTTPDSTQTEPDE